MGESTAKSVCYVRFGRTIGEVGRTIGEVGRRLTVQGDPLCRFLSSIGL